MENVSLSEVLAPQQFWDYILYGIILFQFVVLFLLFSGSQGLFCSDFLRTLSP